MTFRILSMCAAREAIWMFYILYCQKISSWRTSQGMLGRRLNDQWLFMSGWSLSCTSRCTLTKHGTAHRLRYLTYGTTPDNRHKVDMTRRDFCIREICSYTYLGSSLYCPGAYGFLILLNLIWLAMAYVNRILYYNQMRWLVGMPWGQGYWLGLCSPTANIIDMVTH